MRIFLYFILGLMGFNTLSVLHRLLTRRDYNLLDGKTPTSDFVLFLVTLSIAAWAAYLLIGGK